MDKIKYRTRNLLEVFIFAASMSASLTLSSCSEDLEVAGNANVLKIEVTDGLDGTPGTRVTYSNKGIHTEFQTGDAVGIYAFDGSTYKFKNVKFTLQSDGTWEGATTVYYDPKLTYYAYYPYDSKGTYTPATTGTVDDVDTKFANFISDASNVFWKADQSTKANFDQSNLMIAKGVTTTAPQVKFTMNHKRGLAILENVGSMNKWYYSDDENTKYNTTVVSVTGNIPYAANDGNSFFLTKPSVKTTVGGRNVQIIAGKYVLINGIGITGTPTLTYSTSADGGYTWSGYTSSKPSWLTLTNVTQGDASVNFKANVVKNTSVTNGQKNLDEVLSSRKEVSNVDLSMVDNAGNARIARTTANCYLVHAPGTYRIPLVYGNAIKNGSTNYSAYHATYSGSNVREYLVNHNDANITDPWIKNNSVTVDGAQLIWEDMKGMITNVSVSGDYLTFTVNKDHIAEGNAVVSATSGGTVVWSWHIWVTAQTLSTTTKVTTDSRYGSLTYEVADVNLGAVAANFKVNLCRVRAVANGITIQFIVGQSGTGFTGEGNDAQHSIFNTYYQHGRPVPLPPAETSNIYKADGSQFTLEKEEVRQTGVDTYSVSVGGIIKKPGTFFTNSGNWSYVGTYLDKYQNYWDMDASLSGYHYTKKTVYDPCPPGYCVYSSSLFYTIISSDTSEALWKSYADGGPGMIWTKNSPNLFFPASGFYNYGNGTLTNVGTEGYYWTTSYGSRYNFLLDLNSDGWFVNGLYGVNGLSIRPVVEE